MISHKVTGKIANVATHNKMAARGEIFGLVRRPRSYNNIPSLDDMADFEVLERFWLLRKCIQGLDFRNFRTSGRIGEKYSKKLPAVSRKSGKCSTHELFLFLFFFVYIVQKQTIANSGVPA